MFSLRAYRHIQLRRIFSSLSYRQQSDKTDQLIETASSSAVQPVSPHDSSLWATSETNPLIDYLSRRIKAVGPITVADFMQESLANPKYVRMRIKDSIRSACFEIFSGFLWTT